MKFILFKAKMKAWFVLMGCFICLSIQAQQRGVYTDLAAALRQPGKVRVLDLRGQELTNLPDSLNKLQNIEAILIGMKLRNLWLYSPAWKYKLHLKRLPAGGFLHLQGRGGRKFYTFNRLEITSVDFCQFPNLRVLDIDGGLSFALADTVANRMARCRPEVIVIGGSTRSKTAATATDFMQRITKRHEAKSYLHPFKVKQY